MAVSYNNVRAEAEKWIQEIDAILYTRENCLAPPKRE